MNNISFSDDENDVSDDSGPEDPHVVNMDRNKTRAESERQKNRDRFLELEQGAFRVLLLSKKNESFLGSDNEEDDEEFRHFEHEQIRKGVSSKILAKTTASNKLASSSSKSQVGFIRRKIFSYALFHLIQKFFTAGQKERNDNNSL
jgi:hypothetical protein